MAVADNIQTGSGRRRLLWLTPIALYLIFVAWYTDFGGPLSDTEVDDFVATLQARGAPPHRIAFFEAFLRKDSGRQFFMINAIDMSENPPAVEGAVPGESADQLMARYMGHMIPELFKRACHPVMMGKAIYPAIDIVALDGAEDWTDGAVFRYRSRRSFMEIIANPATNDRHQFKLAALEKTIAYPIETSLYLGDPRLLAGLLLLVLTALLDIALFSRR
jgi:hypothetical protein